MQPARDLLPCGGGFILGFPADPAEVRQALIGLVAAPPVRLLGEGDRATVELVLAEVLNNIVEHAYAGGTGPIEVELRAMPDGLAFRVADAGRAMPDGALPQGQLPQVPDPSALADLPEGGFGWHLIRSMTRDLAYARTGGRNQLSFLIPFGT